VIINETMARQYFPGEDPIGKQVFYSTPPAMEIVGVVADIKEGPLDGAPEPALYVPFDQSPNVPFSVVARVSTAEQSVLSSLAFTIHQIQPGISVHAESTMTERINESPSAYLHRSSTWLIGSFATIAFLLSVVGLYGVIAYSVTQRTREIGVRMSLGAEPRSVYRLILGEAVWLAGIGTLLGIGCSIAAATLMRRLLFRVQSWDLSTLVVIATILVISALLASYIPARRAASINPVEALRTE
jgi:ABC-type antimicrobial peptide transport system permease subunit